MTTPRPAGPNGRSSGRAIHRLDRDRTHDQPEVPLHRLFGSCHRPIPRASHRLAQRGGVEIFNSEILRAQLFRLTAERFVGRSEHDGGKPQRAAAQRQMQAVVFPEFDFRDEQVRPGGEVVLGGSERIGDDDLVLGVAEPRQQRTGQRCALRDDENSPPLRHANGLRVFIQEQLTCRTRSPSIFRVFVEVQTVSLTNQDICSRHSQSFIPPLEVALCR